MPSKQSSSSYKSTPYKSKNQKLEQALLIKKPNLVNAAQSTLPTAPQWITSCGGRFNHCPLIYSADSL
jgi:hypothetical protein